MHALRRAQHSQLTAGASSAARRKRRAQHVVCTAAEPRRLCVATWAIDGCALVRGLPFMGMVLLHRKQFSALVPSPKTTPHARTPAAAAAAAAGVLPAIAYDEDASALAAHPSLPFFVSADLAVSCWRWGSMAPVWSCPPLPATAPAVRVAFSPHGDKVVVLDRAGLVRWWHMDAVLGATHFHELATGLGAPRDALFLASESVLAVAGRDASVVLVDALLPASRAVVQRLACGPAGADCLAYARGTQQLFVAGRKRGFISVFDIRKAAAELCSFDALAGTSVASLALDGGERWLAVGGRDGTVALHDYCSLRELHRVDAVHAKMLRTGGVTSVGFASEQLQPTLADGYLVSTGEDGRVLGHALRCELA